MSQTRKKMEKELGRPPTYVELYTQCRTKKHSRLTGTPEFITPPAEKDLENYLEYVTEKYGHDVSTHPLGDLEAWERAIGGMKKGIIKGAMSEPEFVVTGIPSTQREIQSSSSHPAQATVEEVERLKEQVSSLLNEHTQERDAATAREQVLLDRMTTIEQMWAIMAPPSLTQ